MGRNVPGDREEDMEHFHVVLRTDEETVVVASGVPRLGPIVAALAADGKYGDLVLIDKRTGADVIRWQISPDSEVVVSTDSMPELKPNL